MRLVYDDDAVLFIDDIASELVFYGYWENSEMLREALLILEAELPNFTDVATQMLAREEFERAILLFLHDPMSGDGLSIEGRLCEATRQAGGGRNSVGVQSFQGAQRLCRD